MANKSLGLEDLREVFKDDRLHLAVGVIKQLSVAKDRSYLKAKVLVFPDNINMICTLSWEAVGPEAGIFQFPSVNDMVIVGYLDGHENDAYIVRRCTSREDKIPLQAIDGHLVLKALPGKKAFLSSPVEVNLVRGDNPGNERLVLGDTFKTAYSQHLGIDAAHTHIGNLGYPTAPPQQASQYQAIKSSPVDDSVMLSDLSKTEK
jgi:hypothetical protein